MEDQLILWIEYVKNIEIVFDVQKIYMVTHAFQNSQSTDGITRY